MYIPGNNYRFTLIAYPYTVCTTVERVWETDRYRTEITTRAVFEAGEGGSGISVGVKSFPKCLAFVGYGDFDFGGIWGCRSIGKVDALDFGGNDILAALAGTTIR